AFMATWKEACGFTGAVILLIPKGKYLIGPIKFTGPCNNVSSLIVQMKARLESFHPPHTSLVLSFEFTSLIPPLLTKGMKLQGYLKATTNCQELKFVAMNKTVVRGIRSSGVYFSRSLIGTGDDCISIGQGNSQVTVTSISCGPGHGISVGSLGKYPNEGDVKGLVVRDCNMTGTMNGIRIKTWPDSPGLSAATNMTFENIVMNNVTNPIIIDQAYCPFTTCASLAPSRVKLSDIYFRKIRGTSSSAVAVMLECSKGIPCQNIYLEDVHLDLLSSQEKKQVTTSSCRNVRVKYIGTKFHHHVIKFCYHLVCWCHLLVLVVETKRNGPISSLA
ncbi:hypothetical protein C3L33_19435, partial [Rhododendron williamsianum]